MEADAESKSTRAQPPKPDFKGVFAKKKNVMKAAANTHTAPKQQQEPAYVEPVVPKVEEKRVEESKPSIPDIPTQQQKIEEAPGGTEFNGSAIQQPGDGASTQIYKEIDPLEAIHNPKQPAKVHPVGYEKSTMNFNTNAQVYEPPVRHQQHESFASKSASFPCASNSEPADETGQLVAHFVNVNHVAGTSVKFYTSNKVTVELPGFQVIQWSLSDADPPLKTFSFSEQKEVAVLKSVHYFLKNLYGPADFAIHKDEHPKFPEQSQPRQYPMGNNLPSERNSIGSYQNRRVHFPSNPKPFVPNQPFNAGVANGIGQAPQFLGQQPVYQPSYSMQQPDVSAFNQPSYINSSGYQPIPHQGQGVYHQAGGQQMNGAYH